MSTSGSVASLDDVAALSRSFSVPAILPSHVVDSSSDHMSPCDNFASGMTLGNWRQSRSTMRLWREQATHTGRITKSLLEWLKPRIGTGAGAALLFAYLTFNIAYDTLRGHVLLHVEQCQVLPAITIANGASLLLAFAAALVFCDPASTLRFFHLRGIRRFVGPAVLGVLVTPCFNGAVLAGAHPLAVFVVGVLYTPLAAMLSLFMMKRTYGMLEVLSLLIMTLAVVTFITLRVGGIEGFNVMTTLNLQNTLLAVLAYVLNVVSATIAERIFKNRRFEGGRVLQMEVPEVFYVQKAHIDIVSFIITVVIWAIQAASGFNLGEPFSRDRSCPSLLGAWSWKESLLVACMVAYGWLSMLMVKFFSTVSRGMVESVSYMSMVLLVDPFLGDRRFLSGSIVCGFLAAMILISAMVFQTGRLIITALMNSINLDEQPETAAYTSSFQLVREAVRWRQVGPSLVKYGSVILFIASDAGRQLSQAMVLGKLMITPQTFTLVTYVVGVIVATSTTVSLSGTWSACWTELKQAYHPRVILRYLPCGFLFGAAGVLTAVAFSSGINASLNTALGYIYTPFSALASAFVLRKYYMWLEWGALGILTCALVVFGLLSTFFSGKGGGSSSVFGVLCVVGSAMVSVLASLVSEKLLKQENKPFHVQKIALDIGSAACILMSLPAIGVIETEPKYAFWKLRPLSQSCDVDVCWQVGDGKGCSSFDCTCECGAGFFAAWDSWMIPVALFINVAQGWLTGLVIKQFSTVGRALAQSATLLAIYFIGDPLFQTGAPHTLPLTFVVLIIPLSTLIFFAAASEVEKVMDSGIVAFTGSTLEDGHGRIQRTVSCDGVDVLAGTQSHALPTCTAQGMPLMNRRAISS